jgi:hypothetical protein
VKGTELLDHGQRQFPLKQGYRLVGLVARWVINPEYRRGLLM